MQDQKPFEFDFVDNYLSFQGVEWHLCDCERIESKESKNFPIGYWGLPKEATMWIDLYKCMNCAKMTWKEILEDMGNK